MKWNPEEQELINILDIFITQCSQLEHLSDGSFYRLIPHILDSSQGDPHVVREYCQQVVETGTFLPHKNLNPQYSAASSQQASTNKSNYASSKQETLQQGRMHYSKKFHYLWAILFTFLALGTTFFTAQRSPSALERKTYQNAALLCPYDVREQARAALEKREESALQFAIAEIARIKNQQSGQIDPECQQVWWESQFIYAIDFLASVGKQKQAVAYLCRIAPKYYQFREVLPWFTRWSNTNDDFAEWLESYKAKNSCPISSYLE